MPAKKKIKLPEIKERRLLRPDAEQLALLEKAIFHSYKKSFSTDPNGTSGLCFDGDAVKLDGTDLKHFFDLIVKTYATL